MAKAFISGVDAVVLQEKVVDITENGTVEIIPDEGKLLRKVTAKIDTPIPKEEQEKVVQINGNGTIDILPDTGKVLSRVTAVVNVEGGSDAPDVPDAPATPEYSVGLEYEYDSIYNGCVVKGYGTWDGEHLVIPPYTDAGEPVTSIAWGALDNNAKIKSVTFPETMIFISDRIFDNCPSLTHLYMPYVKQIASINITSIYSLEYVQLRDIEEIGGYNFIGCTNAVFDFSECQAVPVFDSYNEGEFGTDPVILVPESLLEEWKQATNWTLYADYIVVKGQENAQEKTIEITENGSYEVIPDEGKLLSKVSVNVNVSGGGDSASIDALIEGSLTEISSNVATVRSYAFYQFGKLESVSFPNATDIGQSAFEYCSALKSVYFPKATNIGQSAFDNCKALTSVDFPNVTTIGDSAFSYSSKLKSADIPNATSIGQSAFSGCSELTSVDFPNVTSMSGGSCFRNCLKLTSVRIPKVESIGGYTFYGCTKCLEYDFSGCTAVPTLGNINAFQNINSNAKIKVPAALYDEWVTATNWTTYAKYIVAV